MEEQDSKINDQLPQNNKLNNDLQSNPLDKINTNKNFSKILVLSILVIMAIITAVIILLMSSQVKDKEKPNTNSQNKEEPTENSLKIASLINAQRNSDLTYKYQAHEEENCEIKNGKVNCVFLPDNRDFRVRTWAALAYYATYKLTDDQAYYELAKQDVLELVKWCNDTNSDCSLVLAQPAIIAKGEKLPEISTFLRKEANKLANRKPSTDLMFVGIEARELALISEILSDKFLLESAKKRLEVARDMLQKESIDPKTGNIVIPKSACWVGLAQVELGRITGRDVDIVNAIEYLTQSERLKGIDNFELPVRIQPCIETLLIASIALNNSNYKNIAINIYEKLLNEHLDLAPNIIRFGDGGTTYFPKEKIQAGSKPYIYLADTAYTNYLIYLMSLVN